MINTLQGGHLLWVFEIHFTFLDVDKILHLIYLNPPRIYMLIVAELNAEKFISEFCVHKALPEHSTICVIPEHI